MQRTILAGTITAMANSAGLQLEGTLYDEIADSGVEGSEESCVDVLIKHSADASEAA